MSEARRSYSPEELKGIILIRLFSRKDGMNANQLRTSMPKSQEWRRFSKFLDELVDSGKIERHNAVYAKEGGLHYYTITDSGRETAHKLIKVWNDPELRDFVKNPGENILNG